MSHTPKKQITVQAKISAPINQVWIAYTSSKHITQWNFASPEWHCPHAQIELKSGGRFSYRMEARDGSFGFDFEGIIQKVLPNKFLSYQISDGRMAEIILNKHESETEITVTFDAESTHPEEMQREGWQAILNNFKKHVEGFQADSMHFEIEIEAPVEQVFRLMLSDDSYREWTHPFSPGSHFLGTWEKGSKIMFLADNSADGMVSMIADRVDNQYISISHIGIQINGEIITSGPEIETFAGVTENYTFEDLGNKTRVIVDLESGGKYRDHFLEIWPKALQILKEICER